MDIKIRQIKEKDLTVSLFDHFNRYQDVKRCWRKEDGKWVLKDIAFVEQWSPEDYAFLVECLKNTIASKGKVYGAFEEDALIGFCSIEHERFGSKKQYVELTSLHVSYEKRGAGIGKRLFETARSVAASFNAKKMYMSTHSCEETQAFYKAMGCVEAMEYRKEAVEKEPCDCQLECETGAERHNGMTMGMFYGLCLGMVFGQMLFDNLAIGMCLGMMLGLVIEMGYNSTKNKGVSKDSNESSKSIF